MGSRRLADGAGRRIVRGGGGGKRDKCPPPFFVAHVDWEAHMGMYGACIDVGAWESAAPIEVASVSLMNPRAQWRGE